MSDSQQSDSGSSADAARTRWVDDAQAALDRTAEATKSAWNSTRESRMEALDSAKQAAEDLSKVIDLGVAAARERWADSGDDEKTSEHSVPAGP
ncbi:MAG TPA: hypothetical protein VI193_06230 [Acidimicrobiia bacterium]